jgi:hypothetical protein
MQYRLFVTPWWISQPVLALVIAKYAAHYTIRETQTLHTHTLVRWMAYFFVPVILGTEWHDWERELDSPCCPYAPFAGARHLSAARPTLASKICRSPAGDNAKERERDKVTAQLSASRVAFMGIKMASVDYLPCLLVRTPCTAATLRSGFSPPAFQRGRAALRCSSLHSGWN